MNTVTVDYYDVNTNMGRLNVNGFPVLFSRVTVDYDVKLNPVYMYRTNNLCYEYNPSDRICVESKQLRGLVSKIEKLPYKVVKYKR